MSDEDTTTAAECPDYCRCGCPERWAPEPRWPLADASTEAVLDVAVELGADALWGNRNRNAAVPSSPGPDYADRLMARVVLGAAAPSIAIKASAAERQAIRQRASDLIDQYENDGEYREPQIRQFVADLLDGPDA